MRAPSVQVRVLGAEALSKRVRFKRALRHAARPLTPSAITKRAETKHAIKGVTFYPGPGDSLISIKGLITPGATRFYQAWYRNSALLCTPAGFNLTNGVIVLWTM